MNPFMEIRLCAPLLRDRSGNRSFDLFAGFKLAAPEKNRLFEHFV